MRHALHSLLVAGLFAGAGTLATTGQVAAATQPNAKADSTTPKPSKQTKFSMTVIDQSKNADYKAAKVKAQTEYKVAIAKCQKRSRSAIRGCMADAKAVRTEALAQAKTRLENQQ